MTPQNACPTKYRNLTPRAEAALRTKRTGIPESPGRLPVLNRGDGPEALFEKRKAAVLASIAAGNHSRKTMRAAANGAYWIDVAIEALVTSGHVIAIGSGGTGNPKRYELKA